MFFIAVNESDISFHILLFKREVCAATYKIYSMSIKLMNSY